MSIPHNSPTEESLTIVVVPTAVLDHADAHVCPAGPISHYARSGSSGLDFHCSPLQPFCSGTQRTFILYFGFLGPFKSHR